MTITEQKLQNLIKELTFQSETDAPFETINWKNETPSDNTHKPIAKTETVKDFFAPKTTIKKWFTETEIAQAHRFQTLEKYILNTLAWATVYKTEGTEKDVFIIGKSPEGKWIGLKTLIVET